MRGWMPPVRSAVVLLLVAVLSAGTPVGAQPGPSPALSPSSAAASASPSPSISPQASAMAAEARSIAAEVFARAAESPEEAAAEGRAAQIERTGLALIDPALPALLAELETQAAGEFAAFLAAAPPLPGPSDEPSEEASPAPSPGTSAEPSPVAGRTAFLAAVVPGPQAHRHRFDQGGHYLSSIGQVLALASREIAAFTPTKGGAGLSQPYTGGGGRFRIATAWDHDTLTLIIEASERYDLPGPTPDAPGFSVTDTGGTTLVVDTCPDEDGTITVIANASGTYDVAGEGISYRATLDTNDHATATVDGDAQVSGRRHAVTVRGSATGDRAPFAGGGGAVDSQLGASLTWSGAAGQGGAGPDVMLTTAEGVETSDLRSAFTGGAFTAGLVDVAIDAASSVWRNKKCLELEVEPPGTTVDPGSETEITVKIKQKAWEPEIEGKPITASLAGTKEVDPKDPEPAPAPGQFTYTATDEQEGEGTITFRSVSNRGIAERTETYRVELRLLLDADVTASYASGGVSAEGTLKGRGLVVTFIPGEAPGATPGVAVRGDLQVKAQARSPGPCSGNGTKRLAVDDAVDASAHLVGEGEARQLSVHLRLARPSAQLKVRVRCPIGGATISVPSTFLFPNTGSGGETLIPITGGSVERSGTIQGARWTFAYTLRREQPSQ